MSFSDIERAWLAFDITNTQQLVLLALADQKKADGSCHPPIRLLAIRCKLSNHAVTDAIAELEIAHYVSVVRRKRKISEYTLHLPPKNTKKKPGLGEPDERKRPRV